MVKEHYMLGESHQKKKKKKPPQRFKSTK